MSRDLDPTICHEALALVGGQCNEVYGHPADNMQRTADLWAAYLGKPITARDVAMCMVLVKVARIANQGHRDGFVDAIGYLLIGESV